MASVLAPLLALTLLALPGPALARRPAARAHVRPRTFASCAKLVGYAREHYAATHGIPVAPVRALSEPTSVSAPHATGVRSPAPTTVGEAPAGGAATYSTTNNQEPGVEEPDIVKTDGATIFALERGTIYAVDAAGTAHAPRLAGSLSLGSSAYGAQLLLRGKRLLVISRASAVPLGLLRAAPPVPTATGAHIGTAPARHPSPRAAPNLRFPVEPSPYYYAATTTVSEVDVSSPAAMKVERTLTVQGTFVDARQNGATARLVIASAPAALREAALASRPSGWVPARRFHSFITGHRSVRPVARCAAIRRPARFSGLGMLSILTIDLDRGLYTAGATALMADAQVVYGSPRNLYVATQRWVDPATPATALSSAEETVIDQFDVSHPERTSLVATGTVPGYLLNQFSLSEQHGFLRVASTSAPIWWATGTQRTSQSYVTVLADRAGALVPVGQLSGLGAGQRIYSVRFIGDLAYVVTFRSVDPLYTIDLSSPEAPHVTGMLELAGYSAYLHPVGAGLLLGVGHAVGPGNEPSGAQLELFDVSNPSSPQLLARSLLGEGSSSSVQYEHHAFLFWAPTALAVLPVSIYSPAPAPVPLPAAQPGVVQPGPEPASERFTGAIVLRVDRSGIRELGRIAHDRVGEFSPPVERSLVIGERLFTLSSEGIMASDLTTLARAGFAAFPAPPPGSVGAGTVTAPATPRRG